MALKLLHCIRSVNPKGGGPIEGVYQLSRHNQQAGHSIGIVSLDEPSDPWVAQSDLKVHAVGEGRSDTYGYTKKLVPWLKENHAKYDAVIINAIWDYNAFGAWRALRKTQTPYFVFTHGMLDPWFKRTYPLKHLKKWLYYPWGLYPVLRDARAVFFTCDNERLVSRQSFWLYRCNEHVVKYGTEGMPAGMEGAEEDFLAKHPSLRGKRQFLFLGRVHIKKGPDLLIQAVAKLAREGVWDRASMRVVMAGPSDDAFASELKTLAKKEQIDDCLYWTGMVRGREKWGAFKASEVFILPSHQENFGIAVAEAMSAGKAVLLGKGVNIWPEIIQDNAGIAEEPTISGTVSLIKQWLMAPEAKRSQMGGNAQTSFRARFTSKVAAESLITAVKGKLSQS